MNTSTVTVSYSLDNPVSIIDLGKFLPLDEIIVGIRILYAGETQKITRGQTRDKVKDFKNQSTISLNILDKVISVKVFQTGSMHITGIKSIQDAKDVVTTLQQKMDSVCGSSSIQLVNEHFLVSNDSLVYNVHGQIIGYHTQSTTVINTEHVYNDSYMFVSNKWIKKQRNVYSCITGKLLGTQIFDLNRLLRKHKIQGDSIFYGKKIVGKIIWNFKDQVEFNQHNSLLPRFNETLHMKTLVHDYSFTTFKPFTLDNLDIFMINGYMTLDTNIDCNNFYSFLKSQKFHTTQRETCSCTVLRCHWTDLGCDFGKCTQSNKTTCFCKKVTISFFASGKVTLSGMKDFNDMNILYEWIKSLYSCFLE
jgi:hypothetical protein